MEGSVSPYASVLVCFGPLLARGQCEVLGVYTVFSVGSPAGVVRGTPGLGRLSWGTPALSLPGAWGLAIWEVQSVDAVLWGWWGHLHTSACSWAWATTF